jgi:predicted ATP-grasp superfamily ATP-dependent carboligase
MSSAPGVPEEPVLILGPHIAALGVLRVLARRGVPAYVVDDTSNVIVRSRWYRAPSQTLAETSDPETLAEYLRSLDIPTGVLIACSDQWALAVAGLPPDVRDRFATSIAPRAAIERFVDKDRFRRLVDELDIPRPRTIPINGPGDLVLVSDDDLAGGFLKPTQSQAHNRHFRTKGFFVESRDHARRLVEEAASAGVTFMLQEYIPGDTSKTVLIDGFVDRHGSISGMLARRRVRMDPPRLANTCSDVTIPFGAVDACLPSVHALLEAVRYRGIFNVEFKFDERDGRFKIIELNARPFWLIAHIARAGLDLPWMSYLDAQDLAVPIAGPYEVGRYGMYEIPDATAIARALVSRRRPAGPVVRPWLRGDKALFWWTDPMPGVEGVRQLVGRRLGRMVGSVAGHVPASSEVDDPANRAVSAS